MRFYLYSETCVTLPSRWWLDHFAEALLHRLPALSVASLGGARSSVSDTFIQDKPN